MVGPDGIHTNWIEGIFGAMKKLRRQYDSRWTNIDDLNEQTQKLDKYQRYVINMAIQYSINTIKTVF